MALSPTSSHGGALPSAWTVGADGSLTIKPTAAATFALALDLSNVIAGPDALKVSDLDGTFAQVIDTNAKIRTPNRATFLGGLNTFADALGNDAITEANVGGTAGSGVKKGGQVYLFVNAAPADADLNAGEAALWFDSTNGAAATKLMVKGKSADGTVKTATIVLA